MSHVGYTVLDSAKGQLEWMSDVVVKQFEHSRENPFNLRFVTLCNSLSELEALPQPFVVLASVNTLDSSMAQSLFRDLATMRNNTLIFTERPPKNSLAQRVLNIPETQKPFPLNIQVKEKIPLEGAALEEYERKKREDEREKERKKRREQLEEKLERGDVEMEIDDLETIDSLAQNPFENTFDMTSLQFEAKGLVPMFPFEEILKSADAYGEVFDTSKFIQEETRAERKTEFAETVEVDEKEVPKQAIAYTVTLSGTRK